MVDNRVDRKKKEKKKREEEMSTGCKGTCVAFMVDLRIPQLPGIYPPSPYRCTCLLLLSFNHFPSPHFPLSIRSLSRLHLLSYLLVDSGLRGFKNRTCKWIELYLYWHFVMVYTNWVGFHLKENLDQPEIWGCWVGVVSNPNRVYN